MEGRFFFLWSSHFPTLFVCTILNYRIPTLHPQPTKRVYTAEINIVLFVCDTKPLKILVSLPVNNRYSIDEVKRRYPQLPNLPVGEFNIIRKTIECKYASWALCTLCHGVVYKHAVIITRSFTDTSKRTQTTRSTDTTNKNQDCRLWL